jgi:hypothetical protein
MSVVSEAKWTRISDEYWEYRSGRVALSFIVRRGDNYTLVNAGLFAVPVDEFDDVEVAKAAAVKYWEAQNV